MHDNQNNAGKGVAAEGSSADETAAGAAAPGGKPVTLESLETGAGPNAAAAAAAEAQAQAQQDAQAAGEDAVAKIAALEQRVQELEEQKLRLAAEVQNTVRRADRDRRDAETYGGTKLARDLLTVYDNLEAAVGQASEELRERESGFFNGVDLTRKELLKAFSKHKIELVQPEPGEKFDPNKHQAMYEAPVPGAEPGSVIQVMQAGFTIADRLLRPAMVGVASAASQPAAAENAEARADIDADSE